MAQAVVLRNVASSGAGSVTTLAVSPGTTVAANLLVYNLGKQAAEAVTIPSGFTGTAFNHEVSNTTHQSYKENISAGEANPAATWATAGRCCADLLEISGSATSSVLDVVATKTNASGTTGDTGTTASTAGAGMMVGNLAFGSTTANTPTSDGENTYRQTGTTNIQIFTATKLVSGGAGATITFNWTGSSTGRGGGAVYKEAAAAGANPRQMLLMGVGA